MCIRDRDYIERGLLDIGLMLDAVDICKYEFVSMPVKERWGVLVCKDSGLAHKEQICPCLLYTSSDKLSNRCPMERQDINIHFWNLNT